MATTLQTLIARINAVDDNMSSKDLLLLTKDVELYDATKRVYDSSGALPLDSAFIGSLLMTQQNTFYTLKDSGGLGWVTVYQAPPADVVGPSFIPIPTPPPTFGGKTSGYNVYSTSVEKYSFVTDGNATTAGTISATISGSAGSASGTHGYVAGSSATALLKWPFVTEGSSITVQASSGFSAPDTQGVTDFILGYGYTVSWYSPSYTNLVAKYPHATDDGMTDIADCSIESYGGWGQNSTETGYLSTGFTPSTFARQIYKFPFAGNGSQTLYSGLQYVQQNRRTGNSSDINGYVVGGISPGNSGNIEKFSFATEANAVLAGQLTLARGWGSGSSSTEYGYTNGGFNGPGAPARVTIDKFSFASDGNATDVGDLPAASYYSGVGWQV